MDLSRRILEGELMDAPDLATDLHHAALAGLRRINLFSRTTNALAAAIASHKTIGELPNDSNPNSQPLQVLDLACGGGDVTIELARRLRRLGILAQVTGWDRSVTAIEFARRQAIQDVDQGLNIQFNVADALSATAAKAYDVVCCTLFLHHLDHQQAQVLLKRMHSAAIKLVLIDDLRRSQLGYWLAVGGCRLLSRSPIVHVDGPLSVRSAFTEQEIQSLAAECQLPPPTINRHWPQRFLVAWSLH